ncbi:cytochrome P450 [Athelia psychrophila]|uniref:Cytochrome P450 n=1 Tax=Athelia psychrophila TaxID=1759441 RepID=A0A166QIP8_9AGAM|nr:cytochrome P450 [Fibularhizoctonia sp. CBS 109695]
MPASDEWVQYRKWSEEFSALISKLRSKPELNAGKESDIIYLNIFERRSSKYSGSMGWGWGLKLLNYGGGWRAHHRLAVKGFDAQVVPKLNLAFTRNACGLLHRLLTSPEAWNEHIRQSNQGAMVIVVSYGLDVLPQTDPFIDINSWRVLGQYVPILKHVPSWFPGAGFKRKAKEWKRHIDETLEAPFKALKEDIALAVWQNRHSQRCLRHMDPNTDTAYQERIIKGTAGVIMRSSDSISATAGADTISIQSVPFLATFVLAMIQYLAVQRRAQAELDSVLGPDRLPTFDDMPALPYLSAITKECHRWEVVLPLAVPHMLTADDEYRGWLLPSGTLVIPNSWAIFNDPTVCPDTSVFNPERFLKDGKIDPAVQDPQMAVFGYGRRICPGRRIANAFTWLSAGYILP